MYVIIAGAGTIGKGLTKILTEHKHDVVAIDIDEKVCEKLYAETGAVVINGNATNIEVLREAGIKKAEVMISLMRSDANNIATSLLAKSFDVPHIIARMREPVYEHAYEVAGVDTAVRVADILLNQLVMEVEQPKARKIMELKGGKANIYAIDIDTNARSIGMSISDIAGEKGFPGDCVFMGIYRRRDDDFLIPRGRNIIQEDDVVFLVSTVASIEKATEYLTEPIEE